MLPTAWKGTHYPLQTYLTRVTARELLTRFPDEPYPPSPSSWRRVLERLGTRVTWDGLEGLGLTEADILRVRDFVKFWGLVDSKPVWLVRVLEDLAAGLDEHGDRD